MRAIDRAYLALIAIPFLCMGATAASDRNPDEVRRKMKQCFDTEILKFAPMRQFVGPTGHADCRPASLPLCEHNTDAKDLSFTTDPQWRIVGQPVIQRNSVNGGFFGGPIVDGGRRTVNAFAACHGSGCGGPGRWAEGYVIGGEQRIPTADENKQVVAICFNRIFRGEKEGIP
jgi:hypothetical protein